MPRSETQPRGSDAGALTGNAGVMLVGTAAGAAVAMLNEILAARFLGVAAYGLYALGILLVKSGEILAAFGVPVSVMRYLPIYLSRGQRGEALGTVIGCIPGPLAIGIAFAVCLSLGSEWVAANMLGQPGAAPFLRVLAFAIPMLVMVDLLGHLARAFGRTVAFVVIERLTPQLCVFAVLSLLLIWQGPKIGIAYGQLIGIGAGVAVGVLLVARMSRARIGPVRPVLQPYRLYAYAAPVVLNTLLSLAIAWTDLLLLGLLTDAETVGIYRGCMQVALAFELIWNAFAAAGAPLFSVLIAEERRNALQETYAAAIRLSAVLVLPLLLVILVNAGDLLALLGPRFSEGAAALSVLACGQAARVAFGAAFVVLIVGGRQKLDAGNVAIAAGLNLALNLALIPMLGLIGAALATAASLLGLTALRCLQVRRALGLRSLDSALLRVLGVSAPLALVIWAGSEAFGLGPGSGPAALFARLAAMGVLIGPALWRFGLSAEDRANLIRIVYRRPAGGAAPAGGGAAT